MNQNDSAIEGLSIQEILKHLPHRYPFLMIDRVQSYEPGKRLTALKNVTVNEPYFTGHFPGRPILPGVLMLEAMAQASGVLAFLSREHDSDQESLYLFVGVDRARFRRQVTPGDQLLVTVEVISEKRGIWKFNATADVAGQMVCEAELMSAHRPV